MSINEIGALKANSGKLFKCTYHQNKRSETLRTYQNPSSQWLSGGVLDQYVSFSFTESHRFVGIFVGISFGVLSTYQQIARTANTDQQVSWGGPKPITFIFGNLFAVKKSVAIAVNKWRDIRAGLFSLPTLAQNSFSRTPESDTSCCKSKIRNSYQLLLRAEVRSLFFQ